MEGDKGAGDDTALNTIWLKCSGGELISSKKGYFGGNHTSAYKDCSWSGFKGFAIKSEKHCGLCDDTAANELQLK